MADTEIDPHDDSVRTVPLPTSVGHGADRVITQQSQGAVAAQGGGEWPSPATPPSDPAPGGPPPRGAAHTTTHDAGGKDDEGEFPAMREVLNADPVAGGSQSVADDDEDADADSGENGVGGGAQRWGGSRLP